MSHVADGGRRIHGWVLPQTDEVGMWDTQVSAPTETGVGAVGGTHTQVGAPTDWGGGCGTHRWVHSIHRCLHSEHTCLQNTDSHTPWSAGLAQWTHLPAQWTYWGDDKSSVCSVIILQCPHFCTDSTLLPVYG